MQWCLPLILLVLTAAARAETGNDRVRCDVTADTTAVVANTPFVVAVHFRVDAGWHVYWTNPGDSGLPTTVKLDLPPGFAAGAVKYPVPAVLPQPGGLVNYGYEREATLLVLVTPPATLPRGPVKLTATADWLVCQERCLIGHASLPLELPTADAAQPADAAAFAVARGRMIRDSDSANLNVVHTTVVGRRWTASIDWARRPTAVAWVPAAVPGADVSDVAATPGGIAFTVTPQSADGPAPTSVAGVLTYTAGGQRIGVATVLKADPPPSPAVAP